MQMEWCILLLGRVGHGIAGGFMSVMNIAALNEAMFRCIDRSPKGIMAYVHARLTEMTAKSGELQHVHLRAEMTLLKFRLNESCVDYASNGNGFIVLNRQTEEVIYPLRRSSAALNDAGDRTIRQGTIEDIGNMESGTFHRWYNGPIRGRTTRNLAERA